MAVYMIMFVIRPEVVFGSGSCFVRFQVQSVAMLLDCRARFSHALEVMALVSGRLLENTRIGSVQFGTTRTINCNSDRDLDSPGNTDLMAKCSDRVVRGVCRRGEEEKGLK
jgi:hypothetical protein